MAGFVIVEIFAAQRANWNQPIGAGIVQFDEQAGTGDPGNPALKGRADPIGEMVGYQPIGGLPFGLHGPPFAHRNLRRDLAQGFRRLAVRQRAFAKPERADQPAMHDKVGIAADRRGEVGVAARESCFARF